MAPSQEEIRAIRLDTIEELADDLQNLQTAYSGDDVEITAIYEKHILWNMPVEILELFEVWLRQEREDRIAEWSKDQN